MTDNAATPAQAWFAWASQSDTRWTAPEQYETHLDALPEGVSLIHAPAQRWPRLQQLETAPPFLYVRGDLGLLATRPIVAIVGSRDVDHDGMRLARQVARDVATRGGIVISGGARGTDAIAHSSALELGRPTISVLPSGIDVASPARNRDLFEEIAASGALVSAYPPGTTARKYHYHHRNQLIAAWADAVIVVRARSKSGSRITATHAMKLGVPLFAVPGVPDDPHSQGCLELLDEGARIYRSAQSLESILGASSSGGGDDQAGATALPELDGPGRELIEALRELGCRATADELAQKCDLATSFVNAQLVELELWGYCSRQPGSSFITLSRALR